MGVTIRKPGEPDPYAGLSHAERRLKERQEYVARMAKHRRAQDAFLAGQEGKAMVGAPENKALAGPPAAKDLGDLSKAELVALAAEREVTVPRSDGREDLEPTVADYLAALS